MERVGAGREAEIFAWDEGRVLRLARTPFLGRYVDRERAALEAAQGAGAPVPAVYERVDVDGRPGLVLERIEGHDLLTGALRRPWALPLLPGVLARVHSSLHTIEAPTDLPDLRTDIDWRLQSELVPAELAEAARRALERLPAGDRLYHGDFHPGNVLRRRDGYAVIDWRNAARADPAADVARTRLLMVGAWIPGWGPSAAQQVLAPVRLALYAAYRREYGRLRPIARSAVSAWLPVLAAARLAEGISQEQRRLLTIARRCLRPA
jgi:aminoglycoside phosphotransferase (APT) family kinase protein